MKHMRTNHASVLSTLFDEKTISVLKLLLKKKNIFYLRDLSRESGVSLATVYRIVQKTIEIGLTEKIQQEKYTYYQLKKESEAYKILYEMIIGKPEDLRDTLAREMPQTTKIYLNKKDKTKVVIVGNKLNKTKIQQAVDKVSAKAGIRLKVLHISEEQFQEMQEMGLLKDIY